MGSRRAERLSARRMQGRCLVAVAVAISISSTAWAAAPRLVADIDAAAVSGVGAGAFELTSIGHLVVFLTHRQRFEPGQYPPSTELGLWSTDGSNGGTRLLMSLGSGVDAHVVGVAGGRAFLQVDGDRQRLWATDGTREGTRVLTDDSVFVVAASGSISAAVSLGDRFVFTGCETPRCELWSSDGTVQGTASLHIPPSQQDSTVARLGDTLYLLAAGSLYATDGTLAGTRRIAGLGAASDPRGLVATKERLFFVRGRRAPSLWTSDGTEGGTRLVRRLKGMGELVPAAHRVYFGLLGGKPDHEALATSDGTLAGTVVLTGLFASTPHSSAPFVVGVVGDRLLFSVAGRGLWSSDGTVAGTGALAGCPGGCPQPSYDIRTTLGGVGFFLGRRDDVGFELWQSDGTAAGTRLAVDLCGGPCDSFLQEIRPFGTDRLLFTSWDESRMRLWVTDLTPAGTRELLGGDAIGWAALGSGAPPVALVSWIDESYGRLRFRRLDASGDALATFELPVARSDGSYPSHFTAFGAKAAFAACDATGENAYLTDGTVEGTVRLGPGYEYCGYGLRVNEIVVFRAALYYLANGRLYRSDGSAEGAEEVLDVGAEGYLEALRVVGDRLLVFGYTNDDALVYVSDGTAAGTTPILEGRFSRICDLFTAGDKLYFAADDHSSEFDAWALYGSDGTSAEPSRLLTLGYSWACGSMQFANLGGGGLYFSFDEWGIGSILYRTDGTRAGTQRVLPSPLGASSFSARGLTAFGGFLFFFGTQDRGDATRESLYRSNGTAIGTVRLADVGYRGQDSPPRVLTPLGGRLFFRGADPEHGEELWSTDGTAAGTRLAADVAAGEGSSAPHELTAAGGRLYFAADDGAHGDELWSSDGTAAGTAMVADLAPEDFSSWPSDLRAVGDNLFFNADDGEHGAEPWVLPLSP